MSIKNKVTVYYAAVLIAVAVALVVIFFAVMDYQTTSTAKSGVIKTVQHSFDEIDHEHGELEIDDDFELYKKGVALSVYSKDETLLRGSVPDTFPKDTALENGICREITAGSEKYMVYDLYTEYGTDEGIWVRGVYNMDTAVAANRSIMILMLIILPVVLLLAILLGRYITKRSFRPIAHITAAAEDISGGGDFSKRLPLGNSKDELYYLTVTLNRMMDRLESAFDSEKQFSSDVSHELKTPVSVVLAECEYVLEENRSAEVYRDSLVSIKQQCGRTMSLIQQLLQLSRTMDKGSALEKERFDLSSLCRNVISELSYIAGDDHVKLEEEIEDDIIYEGDQTMMTRLLINLITNGIKYRREDAAGGSAVKLSLKKNNADGTVSITVEDNGIGISDKDMPDIFNRFYKADKSRSADGNSFGLGLAMARWIAEAHGGIIAAESSPGKGSRFTVTNLRPV
ncbi:MAG: HAMP domain-containing sensor histidine kinase [Eubacteriaceae bacterium]|nr:HAMP domain-containing sensor histidine kinase [Eubacteriaceae bacterium]